MIDYPVSYACAVNASLLSHLQGFSDDASYDGHRYGKAVIVRKVWRLGETLGIRNDE